MDKLRVLVADDSNIIRKVLTKILNELDIDVTLADDGKKALDLIMSDYFDLVITDIEMPNLNGFELCRHIKSYQKTKSIPVIILSTYDKDNYIEKGFEVGASSYISKSNLQEQVPKVVKDLIKKSHIFKKQKILILNKSELINNIIKDGLAKEGFIVQALNSANKAISLLYNEKFDLIITDLVLDEMDGLTFAKAIRSIENYSLIPVIIMYTEKNNISVKRMINSGASACILKPFDIEQLVVTVEKVLSENFLILLQEKERLEIEQKLLLASISSLTHALEARDMYTKGHSENVAKMLTEIANNIGTDKYEIEILNTAAILHDIGKIGIPDRVLLKPSTLSSDEFKIIKQHPLIGADIIRPL